MMPRPAFTLLEIVTVLALSAVVIATVAPPAGAVLDKARVRAARTDIVNTFAVARLRAALHGTPTRVVIEPAAGAVRAEGGGWRALHPVEVTHGVRLEASRDSMIYAAGGLGYGAANLKVVIRRGDATDTVFVSRLGRVR